MWTMPVPSEVVTKSPSTGIVAALVGFDEIEKWLIFHAGEFFAAEFADDFVGIVQHFEPRLGEDQELPLWATLTYSISGWKASATFEISVQGVVVQTRK